MKFEALALKDSVGSEIRTDVDSLLTPEVAGKVRQLLVERGVLVFRALGLHTEQQLALSRLMGSLREEGQQGLLKITLDKKLNARADYLKGSFLWHLSLIHISEPTRLR